MEDFFIVYVILIVNIYVSTNNYLFKHLSSMLIKISFLLPHLFFNVEFEYRWFHNIKQSSENLILKIKMLLEFQSETNIEIVKF